MIFGVLNQKLAHQSIRDCFETLKTQLKRLGYYKAYSIVTFAESCYHQENTKHQEVTIKEK